MIDRKLSAACVVRLHQNHIEKLVDKMYDDVFGKNDEEILFIQQTTPRIGVWKGGTT